MSTLHYDSALRRLAEETRTAFCIPVFPCPCCGRDCKDHPNARCLFESPEDAKAELMAMVDRRIDGEPE